MAINLVLGENVADFPSGTTLATMTFRDYDAGEAIYVWVTWEGGDADVEVFLRESHGGLPDFQLTVLDHQVLAGNLCCLLAVCERMPSLFTWGQMRAEWSAARTERHMAIIRFTSTIGATVAYKGLLHKQGTGNTVQTHSLAIAADQVAMANGVCEYHAGISLTGAGPLFMPGSDLADDFERYNRNKDAVGAAFWRAYSSSGTIWGEVQTNDLAAAWIGSIMALYEYFPPDEMFDGYSRANRRMQDRSMVMSGFNGKSHCLRQFVGRSVESQKE